MACYCLFYATDHQFINFNFYDTMVMVVIFQVNFMWNVTMDGINDISVIHSSWHLGQLKSHC